MGYASFSFDPAQIEINKSAASDAMSAAIVAQSKASDASSAAVAVNAIASDAGSKATAAQNAAASAASDALYAKGRLSSAIFSNPGTGSFVIKEFVRTSAGEVKARYSTAAA